MTVRACVHACAYVRHHIYESCSTIVRTNITDCWGTILVIREVLTYELTYASMGHV